MIKTLVVKDDALADSKRSSLSPLNAMSLLSGGQSIHHYSALRSGIAL